MSIPAVCIVGWANSGKTTLIERVLPVLNEKGVRVGVIKHTHHDIAMEGKGKDTARYAAAGAQNVVIASSKQAVIMEKGEKRLTEMLSRMHGVDLILVEGYDQEACLPMIEVWRDKTQEMRSPAQWRCAVVTEGECPCGLPVFAPEQTNVIADFLLSIMQKEKEKDMHHISVKLDGHEISMVPFIRQMVENICRGTFSALKGYEEGCAIDIHIEKK